MRKYCEIGYHSMLEPLFEGAGVTWKKFRVYGEEPSVEVAHQTNSVRLWLEEGKGDFEASPRLMQFFEMLHWIEES